MAHATRKTPSPTADNAFQPQFDCSVAFAENLMQAQRVQLEALSVLLESIAIMNRELWDQWVCRWAGGVPIDA